VEFLDTESKAEYGDRRAWNSLQNLVLSQMEANA